MEHVTDSPASAASPRASRRKLILTGVAALVIIVLVAGAAYWLRQRRYVYTDNAEISAPLIRLTSKEPGILMRVFVKEGDTLYPGEPVVRVGDEIISAQIAGIAVTVRNDIGAMYSPASPVVTMIDPDALQVVARIEENKGLKDIERGQKAVFTVDAFGSEEFEGVVSSVARTSHEGDVVFNISDKREVRQFDVKIDYDHEAYPHMQNGMSARVWIVK